jgi:hypothetical protein
VHRDLKADNITVPSHDLGSLTASTVFAQVIDFGMGRCLLIENDNDPAEIQQHELDSYMNSLAVENQFDGMDMDTPEAEEPLYRRCTPSESSPLCVFNFEQFVRFLFCAQWFAQIRRSGDKLDQG